MSKPNKKETQADLVRYQEVINQIAGIEAKRDKELAPIKADYDEAASPITQRADEKLTPLRTELASLDEKIKAALVAGVGSVNTDKFIAEMIPIKGSRKADAQTFYESVSPADRTREFWLCMTVGIDKGKKFLGKAFDSICAIPWSSEPAIRPKEESK